MSSKSERKKSRKTGTETAPVPIAVGIILRGSRVLVARRREGSHLAGTWEFPGGKIEAGEDPKSALQREIKEEVGVLFEKATLIHRQRHVYTGREVELSFYLCTGITGEPSEREGQETRWVSAGDLEHLDTPPANEDVIRMLQDQLG